MTTLWSVLTTLCLLVAGATFLLVVYPWKEIDDHSRRGAGFLLFASTLLVFIGLHFATHP